MRIIIFGVGAIGGALAVLLSRAGYETIGIARGAQYDTIVKHGLRLDTPSGSFTARLKTVRHPADLDFSPDDIVLLTVKSQHSLSALTDLRDAGFADQSLVCIQNGVANEPLAARFFANVIGAVAWMPTTFVEPGRIVAWGTPKTGVLDLGAYALAARARVEPVRLALTEAGLVATEHPDIMRAKYGKLVANMANGVDALLTEPEAIARFTALARAEAESVLKAAGIAFDDYASPNPERDALVSMGAVAGAERAGSSTAQSLVRAAGSVETDFLNGEIVMLGRRHAIPTPLNAALCELGARFVRERRAPGAITPAELAAYLAGHPSR